MGSTEANVDSLRDNIEPEPFSCEQLRERHGDYLDGLLAPADAAELQAHLDECDACARYDRVLRNGLNLVRDLPEVEPSDDFEHRLQHRLFHLRDAAALERQEPFAGVASAAAVAAIIAVVAWSPLLLRERGAPTIDVAADAQDATLMVRVPALDPLGSALDDWYSTQRTALLRNHTAVQPTIFPGPYSPLIVRPPVHGGAVRTVSTEFRATE